MTPFNRFRDELLALAELQEDQVDGSQITRNVVTAMVEADSLEAAIACQDQGIPSGKDMVNVEMEIREFTVIVSDDKYESPLGVYVRVDDAIRLDTLEPIVFSTGAPNVVTLLRKAQRAARMPLQCVIRSREVKKGDLLTLHLVTPRPIPGSAE